MRKKDWLICVLLGIGGTGLSYIISTKVLFSFAFFFGWFILLGDFAALYKIGAKVTLFVAEKGQAGGSTGSILILGFLKFVFLGAVLFWALVVASLDLTYLFAGMFGCLSVLITSVVLQHLRRNE